MGDLGLIPGLGRSPGEGNSNPLQCSYLENPHGQRSLVGYSPRGHRVRHDSGTDFYFSLSLSSYFELSNYSFSRNCFTLAKKIKNNQHISHFRGSQAFLAASAAALRHREKVQTSLRLGASHRLCSKVLDKDFPGSH